MFVYAPRGLLPARPFSRSILVSANESLKKEAISNLEAGGVFAFGVSEKVWRDVFANEMTVTAARDGSLLPA
jgi:hypothetical protein